MRFLSKFTLGHSFRLIKSELSETPHLQQEWGLGILQDMDNKYSVLKYIQLSSKNRIQPSSCPFSLPFKINFHAQGSVRNPKETFRVTTSDVATMTLLYKPRIDSDEVRAIALNRCDLHTTPRRITEQRTHASLTLVSLFRKVFERVHVSRVEKPPQSRSRCLNSGSHSATN